jgi:hypothetical protein
VVNVRADGIAVVLGPLLRDDRIVAAALVDVDSGMVLDAWSAEGDVADGNAAAPDLELVGAQHAEIVRGAVDLLRAWPRGHDGACEVVLGGDDGCRHLLRTVPDPHGDRLALTVVVDGPQRVLDRVRKRLRSVSVHALTAGPSITRRPVLGGWSFGTARPDVPARPDPTAGLIPVGGAASDRLEVPSGRSGRPGEASADRADRADPVKPVAMPAPRNGSTAARPVAPAGGRGAPPVAAPPVAARFDPPTVPRLPPTVGGPARARTNAQALPGSPASGTGGSGPAPTGAVITPRPPSPPAALPAAPPRTPRS